MAAISARATTPPPPWEWRQLARLALQGASWLLLGAGLLAIALALLGPYAFGWHFAVITNGSMEPAIRTGSVAVFTQDPPGVVSRGDIVVFHQPDGTRVMHRVASITADGKSLVTKGDANRTADPDPISVGVVEGEFLFSLPYLGYMATWVREPAGFSLVVAAPGVIVIMLSVISIFRMQAARTTPAVSNANLDDRIVRQPQPAAEDDNMRFPLKRNHGPRPPVHQAPVAVAPAMRAPEPAPADRVPAAAQPATSAVPAIDPGWAEPRPAPAQPAVTPPSAPAAPAAHVAPTPLTPRPEPTPAAAQPVAPRMQPVQPMPGLRLPDPPSPAAIPLRGQSTRADARTERLVRSIRSEMEELRDTLDQIASDRGDFLEADLAAIVADPEGAASLPAPVLVRALLYANEANTRLSAGLDRKTKLASKLKGQLRELRVEHAELRGRMETLHDVIGALHANLEDLRAERELTRRLAPPAPMPSLRAAPDALPAARSHEVSCE